MLDPFSGSGTTALVAAELERHYVGIEIQQEYVQRSLDALARERESRLFKSAGDD